MALSDIDIVCLAVGTRISTLTRLKLSGREVIKLSEDKTIRERARKIVLREVLRLTRGEDVDRQMQNLIGMWCYQQLIGKRGRPKNATKEAAICVAYHMKSFDAPRGTQEAIVAELADEFGLKPRRVYAVLERHKSYTRPTETR
jgi:hypothetical protein